MNDQIIPGLQYVNKFVNLDEEVSLLRSVDTEIWQTSLKRRVQHYGFEYNYTERTLSALQAPLPSWAQQIAYRLFDEQYMPDIPTQLIVNEYMPGQGLNSHVDSVLFGPVICSLSLGSSCIIELSHVENEEIRELLLYQGSLLVLSGDARYKWRHGIPARKYDRQQSDNVLNRHRRVSLTFRTINDKVSLF